MERTDNQLAHKLALQHGVLNAGAFELVEDGLKPHMGGDPFGGDPRAMAPVKCPSLLVKRVAARVYTIGGRRMGSGPCKRREGAGAPVQQGVEGSSSGATERCVPRVWNLGKLFTNRTIVNDGE
jgi:hypothetical protein